jgi:hypothetical protein
MQLLSRVQALKGFEVLGKVLLLLLNELQKQLEIK